jgi:hypothetical protein
VSALGHQTSLLNLAQHFLHLKPPLLVSNEVRSLLVTQSDEEKTTGLQPSGRAKKRLAGEEFYAP